MPDPGLRAKPALDALVRERDNLAENLARVQRHLQHVTRNAAAAQRTGGM